MIDAIDVLTAHFEELNDALAGVDLGGIEEAGWALLIAIECHDRGLGVLPDTNPDFSACTTPSELAGMAQRRIDTMDAHLLQHQRAHRALGDLLGAFEDAFAASQQAEYITQEIDRFILSLERQP